MNKKIIAIYAFFVFLIILTLNFTYKNTVTGAVPAKTETKIIEPLSSFGLYSIKPNFKANIDYDLNDYQLIIQKIKNIEECVAQGNEIEFCLEQLNKENNDFNWSLNCQENSERVFYEIIKFYQDCIDSEDTNCLCEYNLLKKADEIKKYELYGSHKIIFSDLSAGRKEIEAKFNAGKEEVSYKILGRKPIFGWFPSEYNVDYSADNVVKASMNFLNTLDQKSGKKPPIEYFGNIFLFKEKTDLAEDAEEINVVKATELKSGEYYIAYPNTDRNKEAKGIGKCELKPKNIQRICVKNNKKEFSVYNKIKDKVDFKNPTMKFAAYIADPAPEEVKNLQIFDRPKDSNSLILKWGKNKEKDVVKYRIYYADSELKAFENKNKIEELKKDKNILKNEFNVENIKGTKGSFLVPLICDFDYEKKKCTFTTSEGGIEFDLDKILFFEDENKYYASFKVQENKQYDLFVTAIDRNGNEIEEIKKEQIKSATSIDDLPPASEELMFPRAVYDAEKKEILLTIRKHPKDILNIDDTKAEDFSLYKAYYIKFSDLDTTDKITEKSRFLQESLLSDFTLLKSFKFPESTAQAERIPVANTNPKAQETYFLILIAEDSKGNPSASKFRLKELGAKPLFYAMQ